MRARVGGTTEAEVDLMLRDGNLQLRLFFRNQRLQVDDKWRQWYRELREMAGLLIELLAE